ncbi:hypothetical protein BKP56_13100 [Marinilactibacillus sp. 15R]|uniref:hypothetical protein n=1 Tax=Marinilactibacillus sp. 15R TaxID=1911586 RepID=UPI00090BAF67|nr:hypothetical protein [Marinilactibacillus sp. 15R]API90127.1 hypothetical protein BKP56_13100 [Marinilactibacillus sp. 15R]
MAPYIKGSVLEYYDRKKVFEINFDVKPYNDSLHVIFIYNKPNRIGIKEVATFQKFLGEINICASKSKLNYTTLLDTNALFFSKRLLSHLHSYEWALRKLIYLLSPTYFSDNWVEESIPSEVISTIKRKQKGKYDLKNFLQWMDLFDFEEYLFGENYILVTGENEESVVRYKEMSQEKLLSLFQDNSLTISDPYSLWSEVFSKYMDVKLEEIQLDMRLIREGRNIVSHNKEIKVSLYQELVKKLKKYTNQLEEAFQKILVGEITNQALNDMTDDFEGYIGNQFSNINVASAIRASESTKSALEGLREAFSAQQGLVQQMAMPKSALEGLREAFSAQQGLVQQMAMPKSALEGLREAFSAQQGLVQQMAMPKSALEGLREAFSAQQGLVQQMAMPKSALEGLREAFSAQQGLVQQMAMPKSALEGLKEVSLAQRSMTQEILNSELAIEHQVKENETIDSGEDESNK